MAVITISRELGSEGDKIADMLCERLGYCRVDKDVLTQIAKEAGVDVKAVLDQERSVTSRPRLISDQMTSLYDRAPSAFRRTSAMDDQTWTRVVQEAMEQFARQGQAVIIGRGGQMVLRDWPSALHVHLYAPIEVRVKRLMKRAGLSELEAKRQIARSDEQKRLYVRNVHNNANWKDLKHYHLAINTGFVAPEVATEIITQAATYRESPDQVE